MGNFGSWSNAAPVDRANKTFADYLRDTTQAGNEDYQQLGAGIQPNGQSWLANSTSNAPTGDMFQKNYAPPALAGLQAAAGSNPSTDLSAAAGGAMTGQTVMPEGKTGTTQTPQVPPPPVTSATPVAPPSKPKRRMITQSSHSLQGLRSANGAGY